MRSLPIVPKSRPGGITATVVLAWFAYKASENAKTGGKAEHQASHLFLWQEFKLPTKDSANAVLKALRYPKSSPRQPWIKVSTPWKGRKGNHYSLGAAAEPAAEEWVALGEALFGPAGLLTRYMSTSMLLRRPKGLALNGTLALAVIDSFGPISGAEVVQVLRQFMDPATAREVVRRCVGRDFVALTDRGYVTFRTLRARIEEDQRLFGGAAHARKLDREIGRKQHNYQIALEGGLSLSRVKSMLKKAPCFYCGDVPPGTGGSVEHFPPKKWGGSDETSLLLPVCRKYNSSHGAILRRVPAFEPPLPAELIEFPGTFEEAAEWYLGVMAQHAVAYANHLDEGRIDEARDEAFVSFPTWAALRRGAPLVNMVTGEMSRAKAENDPLLIEGLMDTLGGIPLLLGGMRGHR